MGNKNSTSKSVDTLYNTCLSNITNTLKYRTRLDGIRYNVSNPFLVFPPEIINDLVMTAVYSSEEQLTFEDLYYLLDSGKLQHFKLANVYIYVKDFIAILGLLATKSQNLLSLKIQSLNIADLDFPYLNYYQALAIQSVLKNSPKLQYLYSSEIIDIKVLWKCHLLKEIHLRFIPRFPDDNFNFQDLIPIFYRCPKLTYIDGDIAQVLEYMHKKQFMENGLNKRYKLKSCFLSSSISDCTAVNTIIVKIASLTCVNLRQIYIAVKNYKTIHALMDFKCLTSIQIRWVPVKAGDFQLGILPILGTIGLNLKNITLINFSEVEFSVIATACPKLEALDIRYCSVHGYCSAHINYKYPSLIFQYLEKLYLEVFTKSGDSSLRETIVTLLSYCPNITSLCIAIKCFDDYLLNKILEKSSLFYLKNLSLLLTNLSEEGVKKLIFHLKALSHLELSSKRIDNEEIGNMIEEINPSINFSSGSDIEDDGEDDDDDDDDEGDEGYEDDDINNNYDNDGNNNNNNDNADDF